MAGFPISLSVLSEGLSSRPTRDHSGGGRLAVAGHAAKKSALPDIILRAACPFELEILAKIRCFRMPPVGALLGATDSRDGQPALVPHHTGWCSVAAGSSRQRSVFASLAQQSGTASLACANEPNTFTTMLMQQFMQCRRRSSVSDLIL